MFILSICKRVVDEIVENQNNFPKDVNLTIYWGLMSSQLAFVSSFFFEHSFCLFLLCDVQLHFFLAVNTNMYGCRLINVDYLSYLCLLLCPFT
jgi:hypothetical protein